MQLFILPLISFLSTVLASPTPQGGPFSGLCGLPFLDSLTCINGGIAGANLPIKDLTCKFTLSATQTGGPNKPYVIDASDSSAPALAGFGIQGKASRFEIHRGVLSSPEVSGVVHTTPASETSEKFEVLGHGVVVPQMTIKYECLNGLPTLFVVPDVGKYFAVDTNEMGTYGEGSWYNAALGQSDSFHTFREIDVVVNLVYN